jgi:hypothetical protein
MYQPTTTTTTTTKKLAPTKNNKKEPSLLTRYACAGIFIGVFSVWWKLAFVPEDQTPGVDVPVHSWRVPLTLTVGYLISLPILRSLTNTYLSDIDLKILLKESMLLYNMLQVAINGWMVWRFLDAVVNKNHPFIGDVSYTAAGCSYTVWIHYCDKYLEFFDTYFMVLRGRMDQVRHTTNAAIGMMFRVQKFYSSILMFIIPHRNTRFLSYMCTIMSVLRAVGG